MTDKTSSLTSNVVSLSDYSDKKVLSDYSDKKALSDYSDKKTSNNHCDEEVMSPRRSFDELPAAAQRALQEAEARRQAEAEFAKHEAKTAREIGGRGGKDPARFGDWEIKGRTIDF